MITALGVAELKMLVRNRTAAVLAFGMPLAFGVWFATTLGAEAWPVAVTLQLLGTMGFTAYVTVTTSLTSRRQDRYLKRLRTGTASDVAVLTGLVLPPVLLAVAQGVLLLGVSLVAGAPFPQRPELVLLAVVGGVVMSAVAGIATSGVTSTAELAQITTGPFFLALVAGGVWAANTAEPRALAVPGGGVADLVRVAWGGTGRPELAALSLVAWTVLGCALALRVFRWDARA